MDYSVKLGDFGISVKISENEKEKNYLKGYTQGFMSNENRMKSAN